MDLLLTLPLTSLIPADSSLFIHQDLDVILRRLKYSTNLDAATSRFSSPMIVTELLSTLSLKPQFKNRMT